MLLFDKLRSEEFKIVHIGSNASAQDNLTTFEENLESVIEEAVPFDFTNIEQMFLADADAKGAWMFGRDAFAAIPPYFITWCEVRSREGIDVGAIFETIPIEGASVPVPSNTLASNWNLSDDIAQDRFIEVVPPTDSFEFVSEGYLVGMQLFVMFRRARPTDKYIYTNSPAGWYIVDLKGFPVTIMAMLDYKLAQSAHPVSMGFKWGYMHSTLFQYGFNLLSCRNVEEREVQPDQMLQRARAKRGKTPFSSYRELKVTVPRLGRHYEKIRDEAKLETILSSRAKVL
jgi:hypothetical protein